MIIKREVWYPPAWQNRRVHIYLPEGYDDTSQRYPVMYFFDGHNLFFDDDATYGTCWGMKKFLDVYDKKMIIVGMECSHEGDGRLMEYNPYHVSRGMFSKMPALGDATMNWIVSEIKPMIDREYRTYGHREATGIGGSSMGGIMALYGLVKYNWCFSKGACISSAIGYCMPQLMKDMREMQISFDTRAFLSWGTREARGVEDHYHIDCSSYTYRRNKAVANRFLEKGAIPQLYCQLGGRHCEEDWEKLVPCFMDFLWKA